MEDHSVFEDSDNDGGATKARQDEGKEGSQRAKFWPEFILLLYESEP
jgi:hypothetical protein